METPLSVLLYSWYLSNDLILDDLMNDMKQILGNILIVGQWLINWSKTHVKIIQRFSLESWDSQPN